MAADNGILHQPLWTGCMNALAVQTALSSFTASFSPIQK
jgi:hypothetical protein